MNQLTLATDVAQRPERSVERQRLADAIAHRTACEQALEAGRRAATRTADILGKCETRLEAAREALAAASAGRAEELAAAAEADAPAATGSMRAARAAEADAEDELHAAQRAQAKLAARLPDLEDDLRAAGNLVIVGADAVLRAGAADLLAEAEDLSQRLRGARTLLHFMRQPEMTAAEALRTWWTPVLSEDWNDAKRKLGEERAARRHYADDEAQRQRNEPFAELDAHIRRFLDRQRGDEQAWGRDPSLAPWQQARAAMLAGDADAPLPALE